VLPTQSLTTLARWALDRADTTHRSRCFAETPWRADAGKRRRIRSRRPPTTPHRRRRREALLALEEPRCAPVGRLLEDVDRPYNPGDGPSPLAHQPVTSL